jgi:hypothetical protein
MISASIALSHSLDRRFGRTTTGAKMTDVPGHTRGLVAPLAAQGVTFLDIGVNDASTPAEVPPLFVWKDSSGASLVVMYHHGYGGVVQVPGSSLAVAIVVRGDNSGPHTPEEIANIDAGLSRQFPGAEIVACNLTEIANAVEPFRDRLPVVTQEIGDSWIYGVASDPVKVARYRELARLRLSWIQRGAFRSGDATDILCSARFFSKPNIPGAPTRKPGWISITTRRPLWRLCSIRRTTRSLSSAGRKNGRTSSTELRRFPTLCVTKRGRASKISHRKSRG